MNEAALNPTPKRSVSTTCFRMRGDDLEDANDGRVMGRWLKMAPTGRGPSPGTALHLPDHGRRRRGTRHSLRGAGGDPEPGASPIPGKAATRATQATATRLDTVVTLHPSKVENGTRLRLVHSASCWPKNETAFTI